MSYHYMKHGKPEVKKYKLHGRTKQSQRDETDINKLLARSAREGTLSHLEKYQPVYADFSGYDFEEHARTMAEGQSIFEELPAEVKREFAQSPQRFFEFVTDPANENDLPRLLPQIAKRGNYFPTIGTPSPVDSSAAGATDGAAVASSPPASENPSLPAHEAVGASLDTPTG